MRPNAVEMCAVMINVSLVIVCTGEGDVRGVVICHSVITSPPNPDNSSR